MENTVYSCSSALMTDLYELTMAASYFDHGVDGRATFSLFVRELPENRNYLTACGLAEVLEYLERFRFEPGDIDYLHSLKLFRDDFLDYLKGLRFSGDLVALPEGTVFFPNEPLLEIEGPLLETQLFETFVINALNLQTMIATKAARSVQAAQGRRVVDFALRRTQGVDAGLRVARATYLAGFSGTSNVLAGARYGIPVVGTMAHSYVTAFEREIESFRAFVGSFPDSAVLLIDTYDTLEGAHKAAKVAGEMEKRGHKLRGVRLDSGDMAQLSRGVRAILDEAGLDDVLIFASGAFDEYKLAKVVEAGAAIDSFGVGTKVGVSADAPYLDISYKLVMIDERPVIKLSRGKKSLAGPKQVFRLFDGQGLMREDILARREEKVPGGRPLLEEYMASGRRIGPAESLEEIRERFQRQLKALPEEYLELKRKAAYPVSHSRGLARLQEQVEQRIEESELGES